jgi:CheY-like chemotaxis protein
VIRNRIILLVEDNPNDVELTLRAFEKSNFGNEIVVAGDGEQAIHYLLKTGRALLGEFVRRPLPESSVTATLIV